MRGVPHAQTVDGGPRTGRPAATVSSNCESSSAPEWTHLGLHEWDVKQEGHSDSSAVADDALGRDAHGEGNGHR